MVLPMLTDLVVMTIEMIIRMEINEVVPFATRSKRKVVENEQGQKEQS